MGETNDHDLIIRLDTKMDDLKTDIKDLKDGTAAKISDHEIRIRENETTTARLNTQFKTYGSVAVVALGVLEFIINKFF